MHTFIFVCFFPVFFFAFYFILEIVRLTCSFPVKRYEAEMEGRRIEAAEMGLARDKLASELEAEAKRQFRHDAARSYKAWRQPKGPPEPEDPKPKGAFALRAERQALEAHLKQQAEVEAAANAKAAARAIGD